MFNILPLSSETHHAEHTSSTLCERLNITCPIEDSKGRIPRVLEGKRKARPIHKAAVREDA